MKENEQYGPADEIPGGLRKRKVAIQGYEGCFHQVAAYHYFSEDIEIVPCATFRDVTHKVESGEVDAGVMAIENSIAGSILPNYSLLQNCSLRISGEIYLLIRQNLMALPGHTLETVSEIHSHPMAILQCIDYIESTGRPFKLVETADTALSARIIAEQHIEGAAAIAGSLAAELYGLEIIAPDIHTVKNNFTRFLIIERGDKAMPVVGANKASVYFKVMHRQGSLLLVLQCLQKHGLNMTKLQSYPIPADPFNYLFHLDLEFAAYDDFLAAMEEARSLTADLSVCGIYKHGQFIQ